MTTSFLHLADIHLVKYSSGQAHKKQTSKLEPKQPIVQVSLEGVLTFDRHDLETHDIPTEH